MYGFTRRQFMSALAASAASAMCAPAALAAPPSPTNPRRRGPQGDSQMPSGDPIFVYLFAHHYTGLGGYYPPASGVKGLARACVDAGVAQGTTLYMDGTLVHRLNSEDSSLGRALADQGFAFGYHGDDVHGPYPVVEVYEELTGPPSRGPSKRLAPAGTSFEEAERRILQRYGDFLGDVQIGADRMVQRDRPATVDSSRVGGVTRLREWTGQDVQSITGHGVYTPPAEFALEKLTPHLLLQDNGPLAWQLQRRMRDDAWVNTAHGWMGRDTSAVWYMDKLALKGNQATTLPPWSGHGEQPDGARARAALSRVPTRGARVVSLKLEGDAHQVRAQLALVQEAMDRRPGSAFVTAEGLHAMAARPHGGPKGVSASAVATQVLANWRSGPPDWISIPGGPELSLMDSLEIMLGALADGGQDQPRAASGLRGPVAEPSDLPTSGGQISAQSLRAAAGGLLAAAKRDPRRAFPVAASLGGSAAPVGFHQLLPAAARAVRGESTITLTTDPSTPPFVRALQKVLRRNNPSADFWMCCQHWTASPAVWRP